jgi:hypothetical protein
MKYLFVSPDWKTTARSVGKSSRMPVSPDAIKFVESNPGRHVIKPSGEA